MQTTKNNLIKIFLFSFLIMATMLFGTIIHSNACVTGTCFANGMRPNDPQPCLKCGSGRNPC